MCGCQFVKKTGSFLQFGVDKIASIWDEFRVSNGTAAKLLKQKAPSSSVGTSFYPHIISSFSFSPATKSKTLPGRSEGQKFKADLAIHFLATSFCPLQLY
jgi:hypothetical protein